jgi:mannitol/fructose-specific phosphotransferase system IIA component (Ntr-type)
MDLNDFLGPKPIVIELQAGDKWGAIDELLNELVIHHKIKSGDLDAIAAGVKKREASMSTAIGFGLALPHASTGLISNVVGALGRSRKGVPFEALDGKPVKLVLLFLVPQNQFQKHLHALANIAKLLLESDFRDGL